MIKEERIALLTRKFDYVNKLLAAHGIKKEDREDLLNEVFILAIRSIDKLKDVDKMESWLWTITENHLKLYFKQISRKQEVEVYAEEIKLEQRTVELETALDFDQVARAIDRLVTREELKFALSQLDNDTLTILNLRYGFQYRLSEIAKIQGKNYSSVKSIHTRALNKLRKIIRKRGDE